MSLRLDLSKGTVKQDLAQLPEKMLEAACMQEFYPEMFAYPEEGV